jgi:hypothetical protein
MLFKAKENPKSRQVRLIKVFAFFPVKIKRHWVFLQYYWIREEFDLYNTKQWDWTGHFINKPDDISRGGII